MRPVPGGDEDARVKKTMDTLKILVVDADAGRRAQYRQALAALDMPITEAASGRDALAIAQAGGFAAAVIDIQLQGAPGMDGCELLSVLRMDPRTVGIPVVFTSAGRDPQLRLTGLRMGAAGVLLDALAEPELLRHTVRALVEINRDRLLQRERLAGMERDLRQSREELVRQKRETDTVRRQATSDLLTGLPNRLLFEDRINGALIRSRRMQTRMALAHIDLDDFKPINERYGQSAGDELLATVARRLAGAVRASDTVARLGGDEFAVVVETLDSPAGAERVGRKIIKAIAEPVLLSLPSGRAVEVRIGASVGMALCPDHSDQRNDLLMLADMAMYAVKRDGGGLRIAKAQPPGPNVVSADDFRRRQTP